MISRIRGVLVHKEIDRAEIATSGGVTYELMVPSTVFEGLPRIGRELELHAALVGREDGLELYGFSDEMERQLFLRLQSASGVGPKLALTMLGTMSATNLVAAIRGRDLARLCTVSGVGKKKAERISLELGDKLDDMVSMVAEIEPESAVVESSVSALVALGYSRSDAEGAVRSTLKRGDGAERSVESLVREALVELS